MVHDALTAQVPIALCGNLRRRRYAARCAGLWRPSQTELVNRTGIDRSTLSDVVRRLQKRRLLQRRRTKDDARAYTVALTDKGRQVLRMIGPIAKQTDEQMLAALPSKQRAQLIDALKSIVEAVQQGSA
jgi:DNA-binding MarR family transcriptional regulator